MHCSCGIHAVAGCCRYKQRALECHPDKHADKSAEECAEFEKKFKLIGEALEILTDTMKRQVRASASAALQNLCAIVSAALP